MMLLVEILFIYILVYLHGGGYCLLSIDTHINLMVQLLIASGAENTRVLAVDYKLAPEFTFPYPIHEVTKVSINNWCLKSVDLGISILIF
jgi:acetyl esterase/lipase